MELLPPASFASAVTSSKESLTKISDIIAKVRGNDVAQSFLSCCDSLDFATANQILDDLVKELTGIGSVSLALSAFAEKFPELNPKLSEGVSSAISESDKVKAIDRYYSDISKIINGES